MPEIKRSRAFCGAGSRTRTDDLRITNALLYRLSYTSIYMIFSFAFPARPMTVTNALLCRLSYTSARNRIFLRPGEKLYHIFSAQSREASSMPIPSPFDADHIGEEEREGGVELGAGVALERGIL